MSPEMKALVEELAAAIAKCPMTLEESLRWQIAEAQRRLEAGEPPLLEEFWSAAPKEDP
jgi:hypothetical protein